VLSGLERGRPLEGVEHGLARDPAGDEALPEFPLRRATPESKRSGSRGRSGLSPKETRVLGWAPGNSVQSLLLVTRDADMTDTWRSSATRFASSSTAAPRSRRSRLTSRSDPGRCRSGGRPLTSHGGKRAQRDLAEQEISLLPAHGCWAPTPSTHR
jgi:hypothetical protein